MLLIQLDPNLRLALGKFVKRNDLEGQAHHLLSRFVPRRVALLLVVLRADAAVAGHVEIPGQSQEARGVAVNQTRAAPVSWRGGAESGFTVARFTGARFPGSRLSGESSICVAEGSDGWIAAGNGSEATHPNGREPEETGER